MNYTHELLFVNVEVTLYLSITLKIGNVIALLQPRSDPPQTHSNHLGNEHMLNKFKYTVALFAIVYLITNQFIKWTHVYKFIYTISMF